MVLTENLFGDILSDESAVITGSLGMLPSATIGGKVNLYEPVHGSAPGYRGQGPGKSAGSDPTGALILRHSAGLETEAHAVETCGAQGAGSGIPHRGPGARKRAWYRRAEHKGDGQAGARDAAKILSHRDHMVPAGGIEDLRLAAF